MHANKSNHCNDQIEIVNAWLEKSTNLYKSNFKDEILIFSSLYSAINSVSWLYSGEVTDKKMIIDLSAYILNYMQNNTDHEELLELCSEIIYYTKNNFMDLHKLQTRHNSAPLGRTVEFTIEANDKKPLSQICDEELTSHQKFNISMEILYQFRCNLVHGCKGIQVEKNKYLAKKLIQLMIKIFRLLPIEIISLTKKDELYEINFE